MLDIFLKGELINNVQVDVIYFLCIIYVLLLQNYLKLLIEKTLWIVKQKVSG